MKYPIILLSLLGSFAYGQNPLFIPPTIETSTINLTLQEGVTQFYPGISTNTMGANGALLGPTLIMDQGDNVNITVDNSHTISSLGMKFSKEENTMDMWRFGERRSYCSLDLLCRVL